MKFKFDHAYTPDPQHKFLFRLEKMGFALRPYTTEHPGKHFCRFISFRERAADLAVYLEFIHVGRGGEKISRAGLSLRALGSLEKALPKLAKSGLRGQFIHKNYDWKEGNNRLRRPGWNFFTFKKLGFRSLFPWITEYEPRPDALKARDLGIQRHPNGVRRILALEVEVNPQGRRLFEQLFGKFSGQPRTLPGGQKLYLQDGTKTRIRAIVLEANSARKLKTYKFDGEAEWRGRKAYVVRNPMAEWNLLIVSRA